MNDIDGIGDHARKMIAESEARKEQRTSDAKLDIGYPLEEALHDANDWLRGATMYHGMRGWKAAMAVLLAEIERLRAIESGKEYACVRCGLRHDSSASGVSNDF